MRITRASTYAVYGLCYLAGQPPSRFVPLSEIRKQWKLPEKHLAKIFQALVRSGHLKAVRGVHGGFALARPAASITALEVIQSVDGRGGFGKCPLHPAARDAACCPVAEQIAGALAAMEAALRKVSLADLAPPWIRHT